VSVDGRKLCPRIILMTDGYPSDENCQDGQQVRKKNRKKLKQDPQGGKMKQIMNCYKLSERACPLCFISTGSCQKIASFMSCKN